MRLNFAVPVPCGSVNRRPSHSAVTQRQWVTASSFHVKQDERVKAEQSDAAQYDRDTANRSQSRRDAAHRQEADRAERGLEEKISTDSLKLL